MQTAEVQRQKKAKVEEARERGRLKQEQLASLREEHRQTETEERDATRRQQEAMDKKLKQMQVQKK